MLDALLGKEYSAHSYNCVHFSVEVWKLIKNQDISKPLSAFMGSTSSGVNYELRKTFKRRKQPTSPCLALMLRAKCSPHLGIYYNNKIIHLTENGVENVSPELASRGFEKVNYYNVCSAHAN